jgi:hypothetical protein
MTFRYARHTTDLLKIEKFYTEIVGLEKLGSFENHNHYNGLFLGYANNDWHLEFTTSLNLPNRDLDEDDMLVFYVHSKIELDKIKERLNLYRIALEIPKNPYWRDNGLMISDPDRFKVIFSKKELALTSNDNLTNLIKEKGIYNWSDLIEFTRQLPYGRNINRGDLSLVIKENKGTCSSKHAFLKKVADLNEIKNVRLILGIYKMNHLNTPKIGSLILENGLDYIPEAHCYLKLNNQRIDITNYNSSFENIENSILEEIEIDFEQVNTFKVDYHQEYLKAWIKDYDLNRDFDEIWRIREQCIDKLQG